MVDMPRPPLATADDAAARTAAVALAQVEDLQAAAADLGWPEATGLADALVDALSHLLVDLGEGRGAPTPRPVVVGAIGGPSRPIDHASCRVATAALRRAGSTLLDGDPAWSREAGEVALDLADLLEQCAEAARAERVVSADKGALLRRLGGLRRRLDADG